MAGPFRKRTVDIFASTLEDGLEVDEAYGGRRNPNHIHMIKADWLGPVQGESIDTETWRPWPVVLRISSRAMALKAAVGKVRAEAEAVRATRT